MDIGIPKERAFEGMEVRVPLLPNEVKKIVEAGNRVFVEKDAANGIFVKDADYRKAGAIIVKNSREIYNKDLVIKLKALSAKEANMLKNNVVLAMIHAEQSPSNVKILKKRNVKAIAMEKILNESGERLVNCVEMSGEQGMLLAFVHAGKSPNECSVLVLGYGAIASGALEVAYSLGAKVKILRKREYKFIKHYLKDKDIVVNGLSWPNKKRDSKKYLITKSMLKLLNKGAIILDLAVDYPGPIETTHPTNIKNPFYYVEGVKHFSIYGYPALAPLSSSARYSRQILPIVLDIAKYGMGKLPPYIKKTLIAPQRRK